MSVPDIRNDKYYALFKHSLECVLLLDPIEGTIQETTFKTLRVLQFGEQELVGQHFSFLLPAENRAQHADLLEKLREHGHVVIQSPIQLGTGETVQMDLSAVVYHLGGETGVMLTLKDATLKKQSLKDRLSLEQMKVQQGEVTKLYNEINNPLQELFSLLELEGKPRYNQPISKIMGVLRQLRARSEFFQSEPGSPPPPSSSRDGKTACAKNKVLVVDDELNIRNAFNSILQKSCPGIDLEIARDGAGAVELFEKGHHSVVLLDLSMPNMKGDAAYERIREICKEKYWQMPSIIFCTAYPETQVLEFTSKDPHVVCLLKPVGSRELLSAVQSRLTETIKV